MEMGLTFTERYTLMAILPKEGGYSTMRYLRELRERLGVTEQEKKNYQIATNDETGDMRLSKDNEKVEHKIEIGETMNTLIVETLENLDKQKKIRLAHLTLFEKFVKKPIQESS